VPLQRAPPGSRSRGRRPATSLTQRQTRGYAARSGTRQQRARAPICRYSSADLARVPRHAELCSRATGCSSSRVCLPSHPSNKREAVVPLATTSESRSGNGRQRRNTRPPPPGNFRAPHPKGGLVVAFYGHYQKVVCAASGQRGRVVTTLPPPASAGGALDGAQAQQDGSMRPRPPQAFSLCAQAREGERVNNTIPHPPTPSLSDHP